MVKQDQYFNKIHEHERFYECLVCNEAIFNPLCPTCLAGQVEVWLTSYPDLSKKIMPYIRHYLQEINNEIIEATACVACGNKRAAVCPYCFTYRVLSLLKKLQVNNQVLREFLQFFNYDFEHTGYSEDAEKLGVL